MLPSRQVMYSRLTSALRPRRQRSQIPEHSCSIPHANAIASFHSCRRYTSLSSMQQRSSNAGRSTRFHSSERKHQPGSDVRHWTITHGRHRIDVSHRSTRPAGALRHRQRRARVNALTNDAHHPLQPRNLTGANRGLASFCIRAIAIPDSASIANDSLIPRIVLPTRWPGSTWMRNGSKGARDRGNTRPR